MCDCSCSIVPHHFNRQCQLAHLSAWPELSNLKHYLKLPFCLLTLLIKTTNKKLVDFSLFMFPEPLFSFSLLIGVIKNKRFLLNYQCSPLLLSSHGQSRRHLGRGKRRRRKDCLFRFFLRLNGLLQSVRGRVLSGMIFAVLKDLLATLRMRHLTKRRKKGRGAEGSWEDEWTARRQQLRRHVVRIFAQQTQSRSLVLSLQWADEKRSNQFALRKTDTSKVSYGRALCTHITALHSRQLRRKWLICKLTHSFSTLTGNDYHLSFKYSILN